MSVAGRRARRVASRRFGRAPSASPSTLLGGVTGKNQQGTGSYYVRRGEMGARKRRPQKTKIETATRTKLNGVLAPSPRER